MWDLSAVVFKGCEGGRILPGDRTAINKASATVCYACAMVGATLAPPRRMIQAALLGLAVGLGGCRVPPAAQAPARPHVVFVTGDCEYRSEITMPMIGGILEARHGIRCSYVFANDPATGAAAPRHLQHLDGLESLETADLAVFFLRFRELPEQEAAQILSYCDSGRPIVALRTSTHAFRYPESSPLVWLNDGFGERFLGQKWISHHGHDSSTHVQVTLRDHPITRGLPPAFECRSWLYHVTPLCGDCMTLAIGSAHRGESSAGPPFGQPNPVAWTKDLLTSSGKTTRVFYTSLGHPADFEQEPVRRLLIQGIYWALGRESDIPAGGCGADPVGSYQAPPTTQALQHSNLPRPLASGVPGISADKMATRR